MWQTECRGLVCGAVGFGDDCKVVGGVELAQFACFPFLLVRVVADEPFSIPSSASIVIVIWVVDGCVWLWDCRLLLYVFNVSCCCVFRRDREGGRVVFVRCVLPIGVDVWLWHVRLLLQILLRVVVSVVVCVIAGLCITGVRRVWVLCVLFDLRFSLWRCLDAARWPVWLVMDAGSDGFR